MTGSIPRTGASEAGPSRVRGRPPIRRYLFLLAVLFIVVSGSLLTATVLFLRGQAIESGERLNESFATIIEEQTARTLQSVDQRLELAEASLALLKASGRVEVASAGTLLRDHLKGIPFARAMWVVDSDGRIIFSSDPRNIGLNVADREYFQACRTHPLTTFHVGAPARGRVTGMWALAVGRPLRSKDGAFEGAIAAALEPLYMNKVWNGVDLGEGGSIALFRRDGILMMRSPFDETVMGKSFRGRPLFVAAATNAGGAFQDASPIDGKVRLLRYQAVSAYPELLVTVGQTYERVLAPWRRMTAVALAVWALASLTILALLRVLNQALLSGLRADAEVQKLAERLDLATGAASIGVGDWTKEGPSYASAAYHTMLGYPAEEGFGDPEQWLDRVHPEDRDRVKAARQESQDGGNDRYQYEARMRHADGTYRWVSTIGSVISRDSNGQATRLVGVRIDITELKQAEQTVRESEARFRTLSEWLPEAVAVHRGGKLLYVNSATVKLFGARSAQDLLGRSTLDFVHPDSHSAVVALANAIAGTATGTATAPTDEKYLRLDGFPFDVSVNGVSIVYDGKPATFLSMRDVTKRKQSQDALTALVREKEALLREVHHRVKNNLALITSLMRLEAGKSQEAETKSALKAMQSRVHSVILLNETLYKTQHYSRIKLSDYLGGMAAHLFRAQNPDPDVVRLVLALDPVEVDTDQAIPCGLIVNELMTNSMKYAFPFGARGEVRVSLKQEPSGMARLCVSDTGVGLPADFETRRVKSLGLQLVSDLARQLRGTFEVGPGPTFTITFEPRLDHDTVEIPPYVAAQTTP